MLWIPRLRRCRYALRWRDEGKDKFETVLTVNSINDCAWCLNSSDLGQILIYEYSCHNWQHMLTTWAKRLYGHDIFWHRNNHCRAMLRKRPVEHAIPRRVPRHHLTPTYLELPWYVDKLHGRWVQLATRNWCQCRCNRKESGRVSAEAGVKM